MADEKKEGGIPAILHGIADILDSFGPVHTLALIIGMGMIFVAVTAPEKVGAFIDWFAGIIPALRDGGGP